MKIKEVPKTAVRSLFKRYVEGDLSLTQLYQEIQHYDVGTLANALGKKEYVCIFRLILSLREFESEVERLNFDNEELKNRVRATLEGGDYIAPTKKQPRKRVHAEDLT